MDARSIEPLKSSEYASSHDDKFGIQKIWFTSLYKQLNYFAKTGTVPELKGRQKEVFEGVEQEFEGLYDRHIRASGLAGMEHRAMLMVCLSIATYRVLSNEIPEAKLVRDVIRTNQGSMMMGLLLPLHRFRIWVLRYLLAEEPYKQAVQFLPALKADMGGLCDAELHHGPVPAAAGAQEREQEHAASSAPGMPGGGSSGAGTSMDSGSLNFSSGIGTSNSGASSSGGSAGSSGGSASSIGGSASSKVGGASSSGGANSSSTAQPAVPSVLPDEASLIIRRCKYHEVLTKEDAPHLLSDFCCNHGLIWLQAFHKHGVDVTLDRCMVWEDECCSIRLARRKAAA